MVRQSPPFTPSSVGGREVQGVGREGPRLHSGHLSNFNTESATGFLTGLGNLEEERIIRFCQVFIYISVYPNVHRSTVYNSQDMEAT